MVAPGGIRHVHDSFVFVRPPLADELHDQSECSRAGQGLAGHDPVFLQGRGVDSLGQLCGLSVELGDAFDGNLLLV